MQWFRFYHEFANDPKVQRMSEAMQRRLVMLMCFNSLYSKGGTVDAVEAAFFMRISEEEMDLTLSALESEGFLTENLELVPTYLDRPPLSEWREIRSRIFERDNYRCVYCGRRGVNLECDHVVPVCKGGGHDDCNLVTACRTCNRSKAGMDLEEWGGR